MQQFGMVAAELLRSCLVVTLASCIGTYVYELLLLFKQTRRPLFLVVLSSCSACTHQPGVNLATLLCAEVCSQQPPRPAHCLFLLLQARRVFTEPKTRA